MLYAKARHLLSIAALLCCMQARGLDPVNPATGTRPNFVVIILDDWGWRDSGAYGNPDIQTPNIDRLASQGAVFTNVFLTASTCTSSRASILTGLHPLAAGAPKLHVPVPADRKLVSHYLRQAGYYTASVGKWHIGGNVTDQFDLVIDERSLPDESQTGAEDWLSTIETRLPGQRPFFLWLTSRDPHRPWLPSARWSQHKPDGIHIPAYIEINSTHPPEFVKKELAMYYDEIHRADFYIGEVVNTLRKKHLLDNTVIILMSDNGSPFWKAKKFLTDPGLKTPFIVYWPQQIRQHREISGLASAVDIAPTLLELAGVDIPRQMEGASFATWLTSETQTPVRHYVYGERGDGLLGSESGRSIRDNKYLYIMDDYPTYTRCTDKTKLDYMRGEQLYDVIRDPDNTRNLVTRSSWLQRLWKKIRGQPDYTDVVEHYRALLAERRALRKDLPQPVIKGPCPPMWWREATENPAPKNTPLMTGD